MSEIEPLAYLTPKTVEWLETYDGPAVGRKTVVYDTQSRSGNLVPVYSADAIERLTRERDEAREALVWYGDEFCEVGNDCCGKLSDDECCGCRARRVLARAAKGGGNE